MRNLIALVVCVFLFGCNGKKERDSIDVTVLRGSSAIAFARWLEDAPPIEGKNVVLRIVDSPEQVVALLVKEETDIAVLPMINAANLYNKGVPYRLAGCPVWGNIYLIGRQDARQLHIFGAGTTPDILTRYYLEKNRLPYTLNYSLGTASEVVRGLLGGKVEASVMAEPFVSKILEEKEVFSILADLNNPSDTSPGFAETAILISNDLRVEQASLDQLLEATCRFANENSTEAIRRLEQHRIFPEGMLTTKAIERCRITYLPATQCRDEIESFLRIIYEYEPKAIGNKLPDEGFYNKK